jgi:hypothetical protein
MKASWYPTAALAPFVSITTQNSFLITLLPVKLHRPFSKHFPQVHPNIQAVDDPEIQ